MTTTYTVSNVNAAVLSIMEVDVFNLQTQSVTNGTLPLQKTPLETASFNYGSLTNTDIVYLVVDATNITPNDYRIDNIIGKSYLGFFATETSNIMMTITNKVVGNIDELNIETTGYFKPTLSMVRIYNESTQIQPTEFTTTYSIDGGVTFTPLPSDNDVVGITYLANSSLFGSLSLNNGNYQNTNILFKINMKTAQPVTEMQIISTKNYEVQNAAFLPIVCAMNIVFKLENAEVEKSTVNWHFEEYSTPCTSYSTPLPYNVTIRNMIVAYSNVMSDPPTRTIISDNKIQFNNVTFDNASISGTLTGIALNGPNPNAAGTTIEFNSNTLMGPQTSTMGFYSDIFTHEHFIGFDQRILRGVEFPQSNYDAANKLYVDNKITDTENNFYRHLKIIKVHVIATYNIQTIGFGSNPVIDGITIEDGMTVLLTKQDDEVNGEFKREGNDLVKFKLEYIPKSGQIYVGEYGQYTARQYFVFDSIGYSLINPLPYIDQGPSPHIVTVAATTPITLPNQPATAPIIIDDIAIQKGSFQQFLLTAQTNTKENGVFIYDDYGYITRFVDSNVNQDQANQIYSVKEGLVNGNTLFVQTNKYNRYSEIPPSFEKAKAQDTNIDPQEVDLISTVAVDRNTVTAIDGVTLTNNMRCLLVNQTPTNENGIWIFDGATLDQRGVSETVNIKDFIVLIKQGTTHKNETWQQRNNVRAGSFHQNWKRIVLSASSSTRVASTFLLQSEKSIHLKSTLDMKLDSGDAVDVIVGNNKKFTVTGGNMRFQTGRYIESMDTSSSIRCDDIETSIDGGSRDLQLKSTTNVTCNAELLLTPSKNLRWTGTNNFITATTSNDVIINSVANMQLIGTNFQVGDELGTLKRPFIIKKINTSGTIQPVSATTNGDLIVNTSDIRTKKDIIDFTQGLDVLNELRPRIFKYKRYDNIERVGLIAQEVEAARLTYCVSTSDKKYTDEEKKQDEYVVDNVKFVNMDTVTMLLVNSVKDLYKIVQHQQLEIERLLKISKM